MISRGDSASIDIRLAEELFELTLEFSKYKHFFTENGLT
jgi:hypothetical protein